MEAVHFALGGAPSVDYPPCEAVVWHFGFDQCYVLFAGPVWVGIELSVPADGDLPGAAIEVATVLRRWPSVKAVQVVNVASWTPEFAELLRQPTSPVTVIEPEDLVVSVFDDTVIVNHPEFVLGAEWPTSEVAEWLLACHPAIAVIVKGDRDEVRTACEAAHLSWRHDTPQDALPVVGEWVRGSSLAARLALSFGFLTLDLDLAGNRHVVEGSFGGGNDTWEDLVVATCAACEGQAVYCVLDEEPDDPSAPDATQLVFDPSGPQVSVELWKIVGGFHAHAIGEEIPPRTGIKVATWHGTTQELATVLTQASRNLIAAAGEDILHDAWDGGPPIADLIRLETHAEK